MGYHCKLLWTVSFMFMMGGQLLAQFVITDNSREGNIPLDSIQDVENFEEDLDNILTQYWVDKDAVCNRLKAINTLATRTGNSKIQKQSYAFYGLCFNPEYDPDSLTLYAENIINDQSIPDSTSLLFAYSTLSFLNSVQENLRLAAEYMITSIQYSNPKKNPVSIMLIHNEISRIYYNMGFWDKSIEYAHESNKLAFELKDTIMIYKNWSMIAEDYGKDDYGRTETNAAIVDSIIKYRTLAAEIGQYFTYPIYRYEHFANQGYLYTTQKKDDQALEHFLQAYEIIKESEDTLRLSHTLINIGKSYNYLGMYDKALEYFDLLKEMHKGKETSLEIEYYYYPRAEAEAALGRYESAYQTMMDLWEHDQTYYGKYVVNEMLRLEEEYQAARKEATIANQKLQIERKNNIQKLLTILAFILILGSILITYIIRKRNSYRLTLKNQEIEISNQRITQLEKEKKILSLAAMLEGQENERIRIAKDLHDGLGGLLSTVKAHFNKIQKEIKKLESINVYNRATGMIDEAVDEVRRISHNLMPGVLRSNGLGTAVRQLCSELESAHDLNVECQVTNMEERLDETKELFLYRIIQESINNILKHAQAKNVLIQIGRYGEEVQVLIEDDGIGFDIDEAKGKEGLGLKSLQSRVDFLDGTLDLDSRKGEGTSVSVNIPLV